MEGLLRSTMRGIIDSLNSLNTPWIAILVIVIGASFDIICKHYGLDSDASTGIIGAGIGLLTGQALHNGHTPNPPPDNPAK